MQHQGTQGEKEYAIHSKVRKKALACIIYGTMQEYSKNPLLYATVDSVHGLMMSLVAAKTSDPDWKYRAEKLVRSDDPEKYRSVIPLSTKHAAALMYRKGRIKVDQNSPEILKKVTTDVVDERVRVTNSEMEEYLRSTITPDFAAEVLGVFTMRDEEEIKKSPLFTDHGLNMTSFTKFMEMYPVRIGSQPV